MVILASRRDIFNEDVDSLIRDMIGDIDMEKNKWTTPPLRRLREQFNKMTEATRKRAKTTSRRDKNKKRRGPYRNISVKDIKTRHRLRNAMIIINDNTSPIPNFDAGDDDTRIITRRFDEMRRSHQDFRRYREYWAQYVWRNQTITIMDHFIHATRYKLPHSQLLRKKYHKVTRYRLGYLFALLTHLKRQQMVLYTTLILFRVMVYHLHMHLRIYEKVVRLDVDIKDVIRMIKTIEMHRRLDSDKRFYDTYYPDESTTTKKAGPLVEEVKVTEHTKEKNARRHGSPEHPSSPEDPDYLDMNYDLDETTPLGA